MTDSTDAQTAYDAAVADAKAARDRVHAAWQALIATQLTGELIVAVSNNSLRPWKHGMPCATCDEYARADGWFFTDAAFAGPDAHDAPYCDACARLLDPELVAAVSALWAHVETLTTADPMGDTYLAFSERVDAVCDPFDRAAFLALAGGVA